MTVRYLKSAPVCALIILGMLSVVFPQQQRQQSQSQGSDASPIQRVDVMRSRLDAMRRSLDSAIATLNAS
ncbi:MAG TPA: hypothetical protein VK619_15645, partial [Pyrinomonadaceae bacterium]|nr:hypothetical protein [Pyrinomonadaceae bacterium]